MRGLFSTRPWRAADDPCCVVAVQNFKGGVGKSTLSVHLAQYLAIQGYRVALIDCDSQARSEEHTSELQSLMRISYAVFCLKKTTQISIDSHSNLHVANP